MAVMCHSEERILQITMVIPEVTCGGCVIAVPGAHVDAVTVGSATVSYGPARTNPAAIAQAVRDAGYQPGAADAPIAANSVVHAGGGKVGSCCGGRG